MIRGWFTLLVAVILTASLGLVAFSVALVAPGAHSVIRVGRLWSRILLRTVGVRPEYRGLEHIRETGPCVFISNHFSVVDVWVLVPVLPASVLFVAKRELFGIPVFGWCLRSCGIPIQRDRLKSAIESLSEAADRVRSGRHVLVFAEGTRSRDGKLARFKKGGFHLAIQAGVPIVPVSISGSWGVVRPRNLHVTPGKVTVTFGEPIATEPFYPDNVDALIPIVRRAVARHLDDMEVGPADLDLQPETT